jgi:hypothetical protein
VADADDPAMQASTRATAPREAVMPEPVIKPDELLMNSHDLPADVVWRAIAKASFLVLSYANAHGEPRSSGVLYGLRGRHLGVLVQPASNKAHEIRDGQVVAVTIPVRKGGLLSYVMPIPPATVSFHARAIVHAPGSLSPEDAAAFAPYHPAAVRQMGEVIELVPEGRFMTYGIGIPFTKMREPAQAMCHAPIG